jgi:hypothetical protein
MDTVSKQLEVYGTSAYQSGKYWEAKRYFSDLVQNDPHDWPNRFYLCMCLVHLHDFTHARHELTYIAEHCPVDAYRDVALIQLRSVMYAEDTSKVPRDDRAPAPSWLNTAL